MRQNEGPTTRPLAMLIARITVAAGVIASMAFPVLAQGGILIARGRDAADVPLTQTFGPSTLTQFDVWTWDAKHDPTETSPLSRN